MHIEICADWPKTTFQVRFCGKECTKVTKFRCNVFFIPMQDFFSFGKFIIDHVRVCIIIIHSMHVVGKPYVLLRKTTMFDLIQEHKPAPFSTIIGVPWSSNPFAYSAPSHGGWNTYVHSSDMLATFCLFMSSRGEYLLAPSPGGWSQYTAIISAAVPN